MKTVEVIPSSWKVWVSSSSLFQEMFSFSSREVYVILSSWKVWVASSFSVP